MAASRIGAELGYEPVSIPTGLSDLLGFKAVCGCGRTHESSLSRAALGPGVIDEVVPMARGVGHGLTILVVADSVTAGIAGTRVHQLLGRDGHHAGLLTVPDAQDGRPHADESTLHRVETALKGADLAVAVGSGTVNDLTKLASFRCHLPYITVATAPSMNGYTSAIAAIMIRGVKRTVACHQPMGVVADINILKDAPLHLIASGLGDLESKPTATADFRLGGWLRGGYFCPAPEQVVLLAEKRAAAAASGLKVRDPEAIAALTEALILSGVSMKIAGSSSPASGGEHLISHYWDMTAEREGRSEGWHGAQVGVATIVTATLYEMLSEMSADDFDIERIIDNRPSVDARLSDIHRIHGAFADEVETEYRSKRLDDGALRTELADVMDNWGTLWQQLSISLRPARETREILAAAGAPTDVGGLGLAPSHLDEALRGARYIRGRFTVLDFAADLGVFDKLRPLVLERSGCLG